MDPGSSAAEPPTLAARSSVCRSAAAAVCAAPPVSNALPRSTVPAGIAPVAGMDSGFASKSTSPSCQFSMFSLGTYSISQSRCSGTQGLKGADTARPQGKVPL